MPPSFFPSFMAPVISFFVTQGVDSLQHNRRRSMNSHDVGCLSHNKRYIWPVSYLLVTTPFIRYFILGLACGGCA
jgi:hypothetical protein